MIIHNVFRRSGSVVAAAVLLVSAVAPALLITQKAAAFPTGGQLEPRAIKMSDTKAGATNVSYDVQFKPATAGTIKGIVVDFCDGSSSPIIGDTTCAATNIPGFTVGASPTVVTNVTSDPTPAPQSYTYTQLGGTWVPTSSNTGRTFKMTNATGVAVTTGNIYNFTITGVTNPTTYVGTFYARIITYNSDTGDIATYAPGTEGSTSAKDYGGIALSTTQAISITAKIQEKLQFCVSGTDFTGVTCAGATTPALIIGQGTPVATLSPSRTDTTPAYTQVSTNATNGFIVRMKNSNTCGGLSKDAGVTCPIGPAGTAAVAITPGATALFGMAASSNLAESFTSTGTVNPVAPYNGTGTYGMDATSAPANVTTTYGHPILDSAGPVDSVDNSLTFAATATNTTPAGLYTANMTLIATGYF
jgi:hypothetical protein